MSTNIKVNYDKKVCFYCNALVSQSSGVGDHFPIPKRNGGLETVPCCLSCHDMKDRYSFGDWPVEWLAKLLQNFPNFNYETKILMAKLTEMVSSRSQVMNEDNRNHCFCCGVSQEIDNTVFMGQATIPLCQSCTDFKNNIPIDEWPRELVDKIIHDFQKHNRETKIFLAKYLASYSDIVNKKKR